MDLGIVKTIRWVLGIDEELDQLRAQLTNAKTECDAKIEAVKEENKQYADLERKLNITSAEVSDLKDIVMPQRAPLLTAPFWNYTDAVAAKLKPLIQSNFAQEAMNLASKDGQPELIELFVKLGIKVSANNMQNIQTGDQETLYKLLEFSADVNDLGIDLNSHINFCNPPSRSDYKSNRECKEELITKLIDGGYRTYPILEFAKQGLTESISKSVEKGANISIVYSEMDPLCNSAVTCAYTDQNIGSIAKISELSKLGVQTEWVQTFTFTSNKCMIEKNAQRAQYTEKDSNERFNNCAKQHDIDCKQQYVTLFTQGALPNKSCTDGMSEFLYIVKELQNAYAEDMKSSAHIQIDGFAANHLEEVQLLGHHD
jgi:hypothetical protein